MPKKEIDYMKLASETLPAKKLTYWSIYEVTPASYGDAYRIIQTYDNEPDAKHAFKGLEEVNMNLTCYTIIKETRFDICEENYIPVLVNQLKEIDSLKAQIKEIKGAGFIVTMYTYNTVKISTDNLEDFVCQLNELKASKIINIRRTTPDSTDTKQWYSVHYEIQI